MNTADWDRVKELLGDLAELPAAEQDARLAELDAAGDPVVGELRELLQAGRAVASDGFLEPPTLSDFARDSELDLHGNCFADFELLEELGRGASGVVYRAHQISLHREVALKLLRPTVGEAEGAQRRFLREARAAAQLVHPGIVSVYAVGTESGISYMAMELAPEGTLADTMRAGPVPPRAAAAQIEQVARALGVAHDAGVVHRDIKPSNILLAADGRPLLADFGLARDLRVVEVSTQLGLAGTPRYLAPELLESESIEEVDPAADVYSLGVVLFEMLTGTAAFDAETLPSLFQQIRSVDPLLDRERCNRMPRALQAVCARAMAKRPSARYESAQALADDLRRYLEGEDVLARLDPLWLRWSRAQARRHGGRAAALLAVAVTAWLAFAVQPTPPPAEGSVFVRGKLPEGWELLAQRREADGSQRMDRLAAPTRMTAQLRNDGEAVLPPGAYRITAVGPDRFREWDRVPGESLEGLTSVGPLDSASIQPICWTFEGTPTLPAFRLQQRLVSRAQYWRFLLLSAFRDPDRARWQQLLPITWSLSWRPSWWQEPILGVRPSAARAYAESIGMRLPSAAEWAHAARELRAAAVERPNLAAWEQAWRDWNQNWQLAGTQQLGAAAARRDGDHFRSIHGGESAWWTLHTGFREWTASLDLSGTGDRVLAGAAWHDPPHLHTPHPHHIHPLLPPGFEAAATDIGFRCARSLAAVRLLEP